MDQLKFEDEGIYLQESEIGERLTVLLRIAKQRALGKSYDLIFEKEQTTLESLKTKIEDIASKNLSIRNKSYLEVSNKNRKLGFFTVISIGKDHVNTDQRTNSNTHYRREAVKFEKELAKEGSYAIYVTTRPGIH